MQEKSAIAQNIMTTIITTSTYKNVRMYETIIFIKIAHHLMKFYFSVLLRKNLLLFFFFFSRIFHTSYA